MLDLPPALTRDEAIAWNLRYEQESGLVVAPDGRATYTGTLRERLRRSARPRRGFHVGDIDDVSARMNDAFATRKLRGRADAGVAPRQRPQTRKDDRAVHARHGGRAPQKLGRSDMNRRALLAIAAALTAMTAALRRSRSYSA
jgi:hypothetical protein